MKYKILVVDDDESIRNLLKVYLSSDGYEVVLACDGYNALEIIDDSFDLVILDVMMPQLDGIQTCIKIRASYKMPIIFLSAKSDEIDKITGLTIGADDYIAKPFSSMELLARVKAQLRRFNDFNQRVSSGEIVIRDLVINTETHKVRKGSDEINLTPKEFAILELLAKNKDVVFSVEKLYESVWEEKFAVADTSVVVHITNLRQKIEDNPRKPEYIKTVWGVGYKI